MFVDPATGTTYLHYTRLSADPNFDGIFLLRLVPRNNLLENGDLWKCTTESFQVFPEGPTNLVVYRFPNGSSDMNCYLATNCGAEGCTPGQSVYQDVAVSGLGGVQVDYGGKFAVEAASGSLQLVLFELDASSAVVAQHAIAVTARWAYVEVSGEATLDASTTTLRYQIYLQSPETFRAVGGLARKAMLLDRRAVAIEGPIAEVSGGASRRAPIAIPRAVAVPDSIPSASPARRAWSGWPEALPSHVSAPSRMSPRSRVTDSQWTAPMARGSARRAVVGPFASDLARRRPRIRRGCDTLGGCFVRPFAVSLRPRSSSCSPPRSPRQDAETSSRQAMVARELAVRATWGHRRRARARVVAVAAAPTLSPRPQGAGPGDASSPKTFADHPPLRGRTNPVRRLLRLSAWAQYGFDLDGIDTTTDFSNALQAGRWRLAVRRVPRRRRGSRQCVRKADPAIAEVSGNGDRSGAERQCAHHQRHAHLALRSVYARIRCELRSHCRILSERRIRNSGGVGNEGPSR